MPAGFCGGTYCAKNAVCLWDNVQGIQYCSCPEGFVGDGLISCKSVPPPCNVKNNCGLNAQCIPNTNNSFECACNQGYYGDGFICILEINCANTPSLCHEQGRCISTKSGYQCVCNAGKNDFSKKFEFFVFCSDLKLFFFQQYFNSKATLETEHTVSSRFVKSRRSCCWAKEWQLLKFHLMESEVFPSLCQA